ncbi:MAG: 8-oxo-dGTP diphosphatase [Bacilli bacterium]|jgi:8-oxo-dGTP pyrophosphatase MutT (NUDIX family)
MEIMDVTNVLFIKNNKVLLGYKKRGFGKRKYNGFGGKLKIGETIEMAAVREAREEAGLIMKKYYKAGEIDFAESYPLRMHLYVCTEWDGEIIESDEMMPTWFKFDEVPLDEMWDDDKYWFHLAVGGQKFRASFVFENDDDISGTSTNNVVSYSIKLVDTLD